MTRLVLVLGDQLTPGIAALRRADPVRDVVVMAEVADEATYVKHHKKKIAFIFSAMRHFAQELREAGWTVLYGRFGETGNSIVSELLRRASETGAGEVLATECGEWRLRAELDACPIPVTVLPDDRFISTRQEFSDWAEGRKSFRMEFFYREMRRKTGLLMEGDKPAGGKWNYDHENRKPGQADLFMPRPRQIAPDAITRDVLQLIAERFSDHPGALEPFWFATTRKDAEAALDTFIDTALPLFGDYQDAMLKGERFLYHSILSQYMNVGLLDPLSVCKRVEAAYLSGHAPLNAAEGFIRQILGWREYVRRIYDQQGPGYVDRNALQATRPLPGFYWDADTDMACMREAISQTLDEAYAHHIQRLMITGTFALIAGIHPHQVHEWYLAIYADAFEWVEAPNVIGMSQFADGGLLGSKPYAASGAYIDRMSDYCKSCDYDVKRKSGDGACPFNPLYWDFLIRNRETLQQNPRLAQMYRSWERMDAPKKKAALTSAASILEKLDTSGKI